MSSPEVIVISYGPYNIAIDDKSDSVYLTCQESDAIIVIDGPTNSIAGALFAGYPHDMELDKEVMVITVHAEEFTQPPFNLYENGEKYKGFKKEKARIAFLLPSQNPKEHGFLSSQGGVISQTFLSKENIAGIIDFLREHELQPDSTPVAASPNSPDTPLQSPKTE